ncbi:hypothetical protein D1872_130610 [compost metagenome]
MYNVDKEVELQEKDRLLELTMSKLSINNEILFSGVILMMQVSLIILIVGKWESVTAGIDGKRTE